MKPLATTPVTPSDVRGVTPPGITLSAPPTGATGMTMPAVGQPVSPLVGPGGCVNCGQPLSAQPITGQAWPSPSGWQAVGVQTVGPILAVGRLRASFPSLGHQREYADAAQIDPDATVTSSDLADVLSLEENRYLARQVCWIFTVLGVDVCQVVPRFNADLDEMMDTLAAEDDGTVQVLVGEPAPGRPAPGCWDIDLPAVASVQLHSFAMDEFAEAMAGHYDTAAATPTTIPPEIASTGEDTASTGDADKDQWTNDEGRTGNRENSGGGVGSDPRWRSTVRDVFRRLTGRSDATGFNDEDRARNYLALKDPAVYALTWNARSHGQHLIDVGTRRSDRGGRRIVAVRFVFRDRQTHLIERYQCQVDTTDLFCFKATPFAPTYD
jgi:hypothetical protein